MFTHHFVKQASGACVGSRASSPGARNICRAIHSNVGWSLNLLSCSTTFGWNTLGTTRLRQFLTQSILVFRILKVMIGLHSITFAQETTIAKLMGAEVIVGTIRSKHKNLSLRSLRSYSYPSIIPYHSHCHCYCHCH